ncbi:MAG: hypothetical protein HFH92_16655 [Lachnospiraceae bacterium]|nr:hypothetical protein [uncultured Acetatifactor sp.]MCI8790686.1 hypothetical protein [Lachnospiraceae bacterium]
MRINPFFCIDMPWRTYFSDFLFSAFVVWKAASGEVRIGDATLYISLARAYFKESEFMILDEPSAALDPISEDRIFGQPYRLSEGKGSVTISHRLSNTTLADKILVIGDGHIIEQGSHFELLEQNGEYARLFRLQAGRYE